MPGRRPECAASGPTRLYPELRRMSLAIGPFTLRQCKFEIAAGLREHDVFPNTGTTGSYNSLGRPAMSAGMYSGRPPAKARFTAILCAVANPPRGATLATTVLAERSVPSVTTRRAPWLESSYRQPVAPTDVLRQEHVVHIVAGCGVVFSFDADNRSR